MIKTLEFEPEQYTTIHGIPVHVVRARYWHGSEFDFTLYLYDEDGGQISAEESDIPENIFHEFYSLVDTREND